MVAEILFSVRRVYSWVAACNSQRMSASSRSGADFTRAHSSRMRSSMRRAGGMCGCCKRVAPSKMAEMARVGDTGAGVGRIGEAAMENSAFPQSSPFLEAQMRPRKASEEGRGRQGRKVEEAKRGEQECRRPRWHKVCSGRRRTGYAEGICGRAILVGSPPAFARTQRTYFRHIEWLDSR